MQSMDFKYDLNLNYYTLKTCFSCSTYKRIQHADWPSRGFSWSVPKPKTSRATCVTRAMYSVAVRFHLFSPVWQLDVWNV